MAIGYLNVAHVSRGEGKSAVGAAAYAARTRLIDLRTGEVFDYSRKSGDLVASGVFLPKGAPERLGDRATLWNEAEGVEKRKDSRTARRMIIALPHELTAKQQQQLLTDYIRDNFMRKGLAVDMNIHGPDLHGDDRNDHAHLIITTRFIDKDGFGKKDRESNERATLDVWQDRWEKAANRQLERYGHAPSVSFKTAEGKTAQIHLGQAASALERKGVRTRAGNQLREIINDNEQGREVANDEKRAVGKKDLSEATALRQAFMQGQATERQTMDQNGREMAARHGAEWSEVISHSSPAQGVHDPGKVEDTAEATVTTFGFFLSWFTGLADTFSSTRKKGTGKGAKADRVKKQDEQRREQQQRELEGLLAEQSHEREQFERRRVALLRDQERARAYYDQQAADRSSSSLQQAFEVQTAYIETYREAINDSAAREEAAQDKERGGPEPSL